MAMSAHCWLGLRCSFVREGGLREPIQRIDTAPGWLQREEDIVVRPDDCLASEGHVAGVDAVSGGVRCLYCDDVLAIAETVMMRLAVSPS